MDFITKLFSPEGFNPRWYCGDWRDLAGNHGWLHIVSDIAIWSAYFAIPLALAYFIRKRPDVPFMRIFWLFVAFIFFCGATHLLEAAMFWWPAYRLMGVVKFMTAIVSWTTVFALLPIIPKALALPSPNKLAQEVSDRKHAQELLKALNEDLEKIVDERTAALAAAKEAAEASEARFRKIFEANLIGILFSGMEDTRINDANEAFLQMVGYSHEELNAGHISWAEITPPQWREADEQSMRELRESGAAKPFEKQYLHKDGHPIDILMGIAKLDPGSELCAAFVVDITERKRLEHQLEQARDTAEIANRKKSQFLANMSHELRTPLNAIIGYSEMMEKGMVGELNEKQHKYTRNIVLSGYHLLDMVNEILDISKIEAGKLIMQYETIQLEPFLDSLREVFQEMATKEQVQLLFEADPEIETVEADPVRLRQILINLISNAIKFNRRDGRVHVRVYPSGDRQWNVFEVQDNGIGIPEENQKELFSEFYQVDTTYAREHEGTGLGLALSRRLVELHGGHISVESQPGIGSLFRIHLPLSPVEPAHNQSEEETVLSISS